MIRVIEGKQYENFVKDMATLMYLNDEHKINLYINNDLENSISVENDNIIKIDIKENDDVNYNIIYMLQKYRYFWVCNEENKDKRVLTIINSYLSNYYMMTLFTDFIENLSKNNSDLQNMLDNLKKNICNACCFNITKFFDELENDNSKSETKCLTRIGATCSCWNVLRKYSKDCTFTYGANALADVLEKLEWNNINEMYSEIRQAFYSYLD